MGTSEQRCKVQQSVTCAINLHSQEITPLYLPVSRWRWQMYSKYEQICSGCFAGKLTVALTLICCCRKLLHAPVVSPSKSRISPLSAASTKTPLFSFRLYFYLQAFQENTTLIWSFLLPTSTFSSVREAWFWHFKVIIIYWCVISVTYTNVHFKVRSTLGQARVSYAWSVLTSVFVMKDDPHWMKFIHSGF